MQCHIEQAASERASAAEVPALGMEMGGRLIERFSGMGAPTADWGGAGRMRI
jgi:hypothetical protein